MAIADMAAADTSRQPLPVVISIGFAGSRFLLPVDSGATEEERARFHLQVKDRLVQALAGLPAKLGWRPHHFGCGVSQMAIGADMLFSEACAELAFSQRIFLPQAREEFLAARGEDGTPDFPDAQAERARRLLEAPHIIHERVVSHSNDRTCRFEDANLEILKASDVIICILRAGAPSKRGGTSELLEYGKSLGKPVLEIRVSQVGGEADFTEQWHIPDGWSVPELPDDLSGATVGVGEVSPSPGIPVSASGYLAAIHNLGESVANWRRTVFKTSAFVVIGTHLLATLCALLALKLGGTGAGHTIVNGFLIVELVLLASGFLVHFWLHHSHAVRVWAISRLSAEISRSISSLRGMHIHLEHLFRMPLPTILQPLLNTVNILHLASTKDCEEPWEERRRHYLESRLDGGEGQLAYYHHKHSDAAGKLLWASRIFHVATVTAFLATLTKLVFHPGAGIAGLLGISAILLPVIAVGALSLAASFDLEARTHTYLEMSEYLRKIRPMFDAAGSERAFTHLVLQVESRLLGETATWASRRSFTGVT